VRFDLIEIKIIELLIFKNLKFIIIT